MDHRRLAWKAVADGNCDSLLNVIKMLKEDMEHTKKYMDVMKEKQRRKVVELKAVNRKHVEKLRQDITKPEDQAIHLELPTD